jgi:hypothetical protein
VEQAAGGVQLAANADAVAFLCLAFDDAAPATLRESRRSRQKARGL